MWLPTHLERRPTIFSVVFLFILLYNSIDDPQWFSWEESQRRPHAPYPMQLCRSTHVSRTHAHTHTHLVLVMFLEGIARWRRNTQRLSLSHALTHSLSLKREPLHGSLGAFNSGLTHHCWDLVLLGTEKIWIINPRGGGEGGREGEDMLYTLSGVRFPPTVPSVNKAVGSTVHVDRNVNHLYFFSRNRSSALRKVSLFFSHIPCINSCMVM